MKDRTLIAAGALVVSALFTLGVITLAGGKGKASTTGNQDPAVTQVESSTQTNNGSSDQVADTATRQAPSSHDTGVSGTDGPDPSSAAGTTTGVTPAAATAPAAPSSDPSPAPAAPTPAPAAVPTPAPAPVPTPTPAPGFPIPMPPITPLPPITPMPPVFPTPCIPGLTC